MQRNLEAVSQMTFDLAVIGGGINGAATAREAALRGLKVAQFEAGDFACGTSSRSSKLIHGGLRYLEQFEFRLVSEARRERRLLRKLAPHLVRPVPFLLPIYSGDPYLPLKIRLGLTIYDLLGNLGENDRHRMLGREELLRRAPALKAEGLLNGALYHDSDTDDARLTIENVIDAAGHGALVANYARIIAFTVAPARQSSPPKVISAELLDGRTGRSSQVSARFWVNAAGPSVDNVRALVPGYGGFKIVRLTKGTHLMVPAVLGEFALLAPVPAGDRIFLMIPWHGHALLGTTDTDYSGDPAAVRPGRAEIQYLLDAANRILQKPLETSDVFGGFAGVRALAIQPDATPSRNSREYRFHQDPWAQNFISICGGKLTTARSLAEKLVDQVVANLPGSSPESWSGHPTRRAPLPGGNTKNFDEYLSEATSDAIRMFNIPEAAARRIIRTYGTRWRRVLEPALIDKRLWEPLPGSSLLLPAEVLFAIEHEMAMEPEDFFLRRSGLNWYAPSALREAAPAVVEMFAERFAWTHEQRENAVSRLHAAAEVPAA